MEDPSLGGLGKQGKEQRTRELEPEWSDLHNKVDLGANPRRCTSIWKSTEATQLKALRKVQLVMMSTRDSLMLPETSVDVH